MSTTAPMALTRKTEMRVAGLFAGIGGFELGMAASGHESSLLCEISEPAQAVLATRFPDVPIEKDVVELRSLPAATEIVVAGFPCQDLSQAGLTAGIAGKRSGLVGHIFRLLDQNPAQWVVLENVSFMLSLDRGRAMGLLIEEFEKRGYRWAYRVVNSLAFVPQRRERVLLVATTTDIDPADVLFADEVVAPIRPTSLAEHAHGFYWTEGIRGLGWAPDAIPTLKNGSTIGIASPPAVLLPNGEVVTPDIRDAERLQGFAPGWTEPATSVDRPSARWSLLGNAVTAPVAEWLGARLSTPGAHEPDRDRDLTKEKRWPRAARFDGNRRHKVEIGSFPIFRERPPLFEFLRWPGKPLSARATRGFLSRTSRGSLRFAPGFLDRLRDHLAVMEAHEANVPAFRNAKISLAVAAE